MLLKKLILIFFIAAVFSFFTACGKTCGENGNSAGDIVTNFTSNADVTIDGEKIKCSVSRDIQGLTNITIKEPKVLEGMTYSWNGNGYGVSYHNLSCNTETAFIPDNSFAAAINNVLDATKDLESLNCDSNKNGYTAYSGDSRSGKFILTVSNSDGAINKIEIKDLNLVAQLEPQ